MWGGGCEIRYSRLPEFDVLHLGQWCGVIWYEEKESNDELLF